MMPLAPTSLMAMPTSKPKIGFSIDSIVGNGLTKSPPHFSPNSEGSEHPMSPMSDCSYPSEQYRSTRIPTSPNDIQRALRLPNNCSPNELQHRINRMQHNSSPNSNHNNNNNNNNSNSVSNNNSNYNLSTRLPESPNSHTDLSNNKSDLNNSCSKSPPLGQTRLSPDPNSISRRSRTPSPQPNNNHNNNNNNNNKGPIVVPGIPAGLVRPFPVGPPGLNELKGVPPYMNSSEMAAHNPHFLAAQFQMAAALAHGQGQGFPPGVLSQHPGHLGNPNVPRDTYPLYPWLLSRHGRIFPHRFPGSPDFTDFLLQPFRKPKRVRTAFSPSQLLKLEHAFESNHYVVGAERKTLAQALSLTETQVKVWFQNRRTKHKRMQQEEEAKSNGQNPNKNPSSPGGNSSSQISYDEDELIDMDDCPSDEDDHLQ